MTSGWVLKEGLLGAGLMDRMGFIFHDDANLQLESFGTKCAYWALSDCLVKQNEQNVLFKKVSAVKTEPCAINL